MKVTCLGSFQSASDEQARSAPCTYRIYNKVLFSDNIPFQWHRLRFSLQNMPVWAPPSVPDLARAGGEDLTCPPIDVALGSRSLPGELQVPGLPKKHFYHALQAPSSGLGQ